MSPGFVKESLALPTLLADLLKFYSVMLPEASSALIDNNGSADFLGLLNLLHFSAGIPYLNWLIFAKGLSNLTLLWQCSQNRKD